MELKVIDEQTYKTFALKNEYLSIYQLPEWGKLKEQNGWHPHLVGLYDEHTLKAVTLLLEKPTAIKKSLFYAPRGFLLDYHDEKLLRIMIAEIVKYVKNHKGFMLKIDPNVIYALRTSNGEEKAVVGSVTLDLLKKCGFKHLGFTQNFETLQPRFLCRFELKDTYEETVQTFTKNTRKNIEKYNNMGISIREAKENEIDLFCDLLKATADAKNFVIRPTKYYKTMYELMHDYLKFYLVYLDPHEYLKHLEKEQDEINGELKTLNEQMVKVNVGEKLRKKESILKTRQIKCQERLKEAQQMTEPIYIGALMSIFLGDEGITFMSGTVAKYKDFGPKYVFYNEHIKECIKQKKKYCNFYGISGNMNPQSPYYSIYEIKKGFNPEIVELLGEFDYIVNPFYYDLYKVSLKFYKLFK